MRQNRKSKAQFGFSLLETLLVVGIIFTITAIALPKMTTVIQQQRLTSSAQTYASFLQLARERAIQDDQFYQVQTTIIDSNKPIAYIDVNGNGTLDNGETSIQLPAPVVISDTGVPAGFDTNTLLGATPLYSTDPNVAAMTALDGNQRAGLAFNGRGLPCQRYASTDPCTVAPGGNPVAWVTYLQYRVGGATNYAAVTVTPAGRIKSWYYDSSSQKWK